MVLPGGRPYGKTGIVGTFFTKDYLGLPAEFLAMPGFRVDLPWTPKTGIGHLVDLACRRKSILVFFGAGNVKTWETLGAN